MKCINCNKEIKNLDSACYSGHHDGYFCSLCCLTNYAHEYFRCRAVEVKELLCKGKEVRK